MRPVETLGKSLDALQEDLDIAEAGELAEADEYSEVWVYRKSGLVARTTSGYVAAVVLYSDGHEGFAGYQGDIGDLRLDTSKQIVRFKFGYPTMHEEGGFEAGRGEPLHYDRYDYDDHSLQFEYDGSGKWLRSLTIVAADELRQAKEASKVTPDGPVVYDKAKYHLDSVANLDLPEEQAAVHTAFFLGWLMDNDLCSEEFIEDSGAQIEAYRKRKLTALEVYARWDYCLVDDMLNDEGNAFAQSYFDFSTGQYASDYKALLARKELSVLHVPYTWENQKKIGHQISKRYVKWKHPERRVSLRQNRERRGNSDSPARPGKKRPVKSTHRKKPPNRKKQANHSAGRRPAGRSWLRSIPTWVYKFIVFPILFVGICLGFVIYSGVL